MGMTSDTALEVPASSRRKMLVPLALAQFICSFAGSNMNVMINDISRDLHTDVQGVQVCITLFLLVMAALMIPCGKLTDRYGRKRLFQFGLMIYGVGAIISAVSPERRSVSSSPPGKGGSPPSRLGCLLTAATAG
jgi:MFS family permease